MRLPGSHNSKEHIGWKEVEIVELHPERRFELDDIEEWLSEQSPVTLRKSRELARSVGEIDDVLKWFKDFAKAHGFKAPIDVEQRLRDMMYMGSGDCGIHATQLAVSASLLNRGTPKADVVALLLHHTKIAAGTYGTVGIGVARSAASRRCATTGCASIRSRKSRSKTPPPLIPHRLLTRIRMLKGGRPRPVATTPALTLISAQAQSRIKRAMPHWLN
jgi:hypothetical protein